VSYLIIATIVIIVAVIAVINGVGLRRQGKRDEGNAWILASALAVIVLVGGWQRLQAPLVLGGGVLAAVALHELAPWVSGVVADLPRWLPLAAAGLLLLVVGATYEQRRRDVRRMRDALMRMS